MLPEVAHHLERLGLNADSPPSAGEWRAFLEGLGGRLAGAAPWQRQAVEHSPNPIFVTDREGRVRHANRAFAALFGNGPLGEPWGRLCSGEEAGRLAELTRRVLAGEAFGRVELRLSAADGSERHLLSRLYPLRDDGGEVLGCVCAGTDVSEQRREAETLLAQRRSYERVLNAVPAPLAIFDPSHRYVFCNPAAIRDDEVRAWIIGKDDFEYCAHRGHDPALAERRRQLFREAARTRETVFWEERFDTPEGGVRHWLRCLSPVFSDSGDLDLMIGYGLDISERKRTLEALGQLNGELEAANRRLRHDSLHDALTGLPNRVLFNERLEGALARARSGHGPGFAVLFLDADRFKEVNDSLGHPVGDALLVALARRLHAELRPGDTVARLGGDEFTVLLEGLGGVGDATAVAERIGAALRRPFEVEGHELCLSVSIGIVLGTCDSGSGGYVSAAEMLRDADIAMYRAKAQGRAGHQVFQVELRERALDLITLERDLRRAARQGELRVLYQPIVALGGRRTVGFEALLRWQHPTRGLLSPADFLGVAEESGLIVELDRWVLREACVQVRAWERERPGHPPLSLSVNFSGRHFAMSDVSAFLGRTLEETGFDPRHLDLELTESVLLEPSPATRETLARLRGLGVGLHLDDFGTGYSSLGYLQSYPVDALKIDRSFTGRMLGSPQSAELVRTIVTMAKNLGLRVIAEGIEVPAQLEHLRALGCDYGQGYLLSRPLTPEQVPAFLHGEGQGVGEAGELRNAG